ncbi:fibroblast growth factor binding protein 2a [Amphiprion ocellaris]|uniref:fibroblast growth factor binding protein 2a n=1 Tax=Amphiprion ocellaris TaxID=80972 RepID=UPI000C304F46|nr:fibroblast growth factor binding protein 2a [Amphiprion ocellaris]
MWSQAVALLLACCFWPAEAQSDGRRQSIWDDPIRFSTKAKDVCTMSVTGHGEYTKLRLSCQSNRRSYWCEYVGKPQTCRTYNKNPRHYFVQMMWNLRKLHNACQAPREIKPHMCRKATDESQMVFSSASFPRPLGTRPAMQPARPQPPLAPTRPDSARQAATKTIRVPQRVKTTQRASPQPTTPPVESTGKRVARRYCWRSLQGICSFVVGLFRN